MEAHYGASCGLINSRLVAAMLEANVDPVAKSAGKEEQAHYHPPVSLENHRRDTKEREKADPREDYTPKYT